MGDQRSPRRVVLASASPARLAILRRAGLHPEVAVSGLDESAVAAATAAEVAQARAEAKAQAVAERLDTPALVVGCDSVLELDGEVYGRPPDSAEARSRWRRMRGRAGVLHTGHWVVDTSTGRSVGGTGSTLVRFAEVSDDEIDAYVATGEPLQVAGGFTVDGLGGPFVRRVDGDHHNVVGLSLPLLRDLFAELGVRWTDLWAG
ncbi:MAG: Maf family nucleotide pyrophosphatase [Actinomycetota bacterium]|nr:Maf family nucleotide pyrophosphatase [Actinomycetota bacterium]